MGGPGSGRKKGARRYSNQLPPALKKKAKSVNKKIQSGRFDLKLPGTERSTGPRESYREH